MNHFVGRVAALALCLAPAPALALESGAAEPQQERLICKKWAEVGSLVRKKKQCHTKKEWDRLAESERVGVTKTMDGLTERSGCADPTTC